jgi:hypothetical protein
MAPDSSMLFARVEQAEALTDARTGWRIDVIWLGDRRARMSGRRPAQDDR